MLNTADTLPKSNLSLRNSGYDMWDLGMALDYKSTLGAHGMKQGVFVETLERMRL